MRSLGPLLSSRSRANGEGKGLVKILADAETDRVLGVHIVGVSAGELIAEVSRALLPGLWLRGLLAAAASCAPAGLG